MTRIRYDTGMDQTQGYQRAFLELAIGLGALGFGRYTLKSGRQSPYFFNAGVFNTGSAIGALGRFYAEVIVATDLEFDMLFGPAYKGIPLAAVSAAALADHHGIDTGFAYNRKEAKQHGEGGSIVGAPVAGRVLISTSGFSSHFNKLCFPILFEIAFISALHSGAPISTSRP